MAKFSDYVIAGSGKTVKVGKGLYTTVATADVIAEGGTLLVQGTADIDNMLGKYQGSFMLQIKLAGGDSATSGAATVTLDLDGTMSDGEGAFAVSGSKLKVSGDLGGKAVDLTIYKDSSVTWVDPGLGGLLWVKVQ